MFKKDAIAHYGTQVALADALGITKGAIPQWSDLVPELQARRLESLTEGKLKFDESLYRESA